MIDDADRGPNASDVREQKPRRPGPRTPEGKRRSKLNAVQTGIFAKVVLTGEPFRESQEDFKGLLAGLRESIRPGDRFEEMMVENLAFQFLRLARVYRADAAVAPLLFTRVRERLEGEASDAEISGLLGDKSVSVDKLPAAELLVRYEASVWRQIERILDRLQQWRRPPE